MPRWLDEMTEAVSRLVKPGTTEARGRQAALGAVAYLEPGWYALPTVNRTVDPDNLTDLRLAASPAEADKGTSYQVIDCVAEAERLRVRVGAHAPRSGLNLFAMQRPAGFLDQSLLDALRALGEPGLAARFIENRLDAVGGTGASEGPFQGAQADAFRACTRAGTALIWGPPGTGKTTVLSRVIDHHLTRGKRVLLVSGTNVAVDNALQGAVALRNPQPGELLRVGTPHLATVAKDERVSLSLLVRAKLESAVQAREDAERDLVELTAHPVLRSLAELDQRLAGFDESAYQQARERLANKAAVRQVDDLVAEWQERVHLRAVARSNAENALEAALADQQRVAPQREALHAADALATELSDLDLLMQRAGVQLHGLQDRLSTATAERDMLRNDSGRIRRRDKKDHARLAENVTALTHAVNAGIRRLQDLEHDRNAFAISAKPRIEGLRQTAYPIGEADLHRLDQAVARLRTEAADADRQLASDRAEYEQTVALRAEAAALPGPTAEDRGLIDSAERHRFPDLALQQVALRTEAEPLLKRRDELEKRHESLLKKLSRLQSEAEPELIRGAKLVATTLARLRLNKTVAEGNYDVVLIDEAAAARLPELVVALAKAGETAVLLGDFCQLGPIPPQNGPKPEYLRRWLTTDCFAQVGIRTPDAALAHPACAALLTTHRFGPHIVELVNRIAYGGHLRITPDRVHSGDAEIVLVTTDELAADDGLGLVRKPKSGSGRWWTGGSVVSAALAEHHRGQGESVGVITPYRAQVDATRDYLDDQDSTHRTSSVEVGTAHSFQGREFDIVIMDLVEDGVQPGWTMSGRLDSDRQFARDGARLLNVGVSRARRRVYVVTSWRSLGQARPGTVLAALHGLAVDGEEPIVKGLRAAQFLGLEPDELPSETSELQQEIWEAFQGHLKWEAIHDEHSYFPAALQAIAEARHSIWLWSPWYGKRQETLLPYLRDATARGVRTTVFVVGERDSLVRKQLNDKDPQKAADFAALLPALRAAVQQVVHVHDMHQKIMVVDERTVFLGSLNTLSHRTRREIMTHHTSARYARSLLEQVNAEIFSRPPACQTCAVPTELRRSLSDKKDHYWYWACPTKGCATRKAVFAEHEHHVPRRGAAGSTAPRRPTG
jgi:hypothetical protein